MTTCQHCHRPNNLYLCDNCQTQLANMLDQIPWLLTELDNRIAQLDRTNTGTIGRTRRPDELNPIDFDALETSRKIRKTLQHWVTTIATKATGRPPNSLHTATTPDLARWLNHNIGHIARLDLNHKGHHQLYDAITHITGTPNKPGTLHRAINPTEHHLAGPCPTITGRNHNGTPRQCETMLFADTYDQTVTCPTCHQDINVEDNRRKAAADRDLHTQTELIDTLNAINEPITPAQLTAWTRARRLRPAAYRHDQTITEYRIHPNDEPLYSLERTRKLQRRDNDPTRRKQPTHPFLTR